VTAGLAIYDTMQYVNAPVGTLCMGQAASMGSLLLAAGEPGMRKVLPNAQVMLHQPSGGAQGQAADIAAGRAEASARVEGWPPVYLASSRRAPRNHRRPSWPRRSSRRARSSTAPPGVGEAWGFFGVQRVFRDVPWTRNDDVRCNSEQKRPNAGIYVNHTGQSLEDVERVMDRDTYFSAQEAYDFGVVDEVVEPRVPRYLEKMAA